MIELTLFNEEKGLYGLIANGQLAGSTLDYLMEGYKVYPGDISIYIKSQDDFDLIQKYRLKDLPKEVNLHLNFQHIWSEVFTITNLYQNRRCRQDKPDRRNESFKK